MACDAEMCEFWTGSGCICDVMGIERPASTRCAACGCDIEDHNAADDSCSNCGIDCEGYR